MIDEKEKAWEDYVSSSKGYWSEIIAFYKGFDDGVKAERERIKNILGEKSFIRLAIRKELFPNEGGEA